MSDSAADFKRQAGETAVDRFVESGMVIGLGHGSTAIWAHRRIAEKLKSGDLKDIIGVPASRQVEVEVAPLGIPLATLDDRPRLDLTLDGADEVDEWLNLIKGGGGALLREKMLVQNSARFVVVADQGKMSPRIGTKWFVPIEVIRTGWATHLEYLTGLGGMGARRGVDRPYITDEGHYIIDWRFGAINNPESLAARLKARAGIVEHGMFLGLADDLIIAGPEGIQHLTRK